MDENRDTSPDRDFYRRYREKLYGNLCGEGSEELRDIQRLQEKNYATEGGAGRGPDRSRRPVPETGVQHLQGEDTETCLSHVQVIPRAKFDRVTLLTGIIYAMTQLQPFAAVQQALTLHDEIERQLKEAP